MLFNRYIGEIISDSEAERRTYDDNYIFDLDIKVLKISNYDDIIYCTSES